MDSCAGFCDQHHLVDGRGGLEHGIADTCVRTLRGKKVQTSLPVQSAVHVLEPSRVHRGTTANLRPGPGMLQHEVNGDDAVQDFCLLSQILVQQIPNAVPEAVVHGG